MRSARAVAAWCASVVTCASLLAGLVIVEQVSRNRLAHLWHNVLEVTIAFGGAYALTAALVHVPTFIAWDHLRRGTRRVEATVLGGVLGVVAILVVAVVFRESEDPATVIGWARYWASRPRRLLVGGTPYIAAGAVFGYGWWTGSAAPEQNAIHGGIEHG